MPKTTDVRALRRQKMRGEPVDRTIVDDARRVFESLIPERAARQAIYRAWAAAIRTAHERAPSSWSITLQPRQVRLNVGRILLTEVLPDHIWLAALDETPGVRVLEPWRIPDTSFGSVEEAHHAILVPGAEVPRLGESIQATLVDMAIVGTRTARSSVYRQAWSPAVVALLEDELGTELPRPEWIPELPIPRWWRAADGPAPDSIRMGDGVLSRGPNGVEATIVLRNQDGDLRLTRPRPLSGKLPDDDGWRMLTAAERIAVGVDTAPGPSDTAESSTLPTATFIESEVKGLADRLAEDARPLEKILAARQAFSERFSPERLAASEGRELLERMHGRDSKDSLAYWLEFKDDEQFATREFGSIAGGSALKFGLFQRADDGTWVTGSSRNMQTIGIDEAIALATQQRDELLAAWEVLDALPDDPADPAWQSLSADIQAAAPSIHQLAFVHKTLSVWLPEKIDDFHNIRYHQHIMAGVGVALPGNDLYEAAPAFVGLLQRVRHFVPGLDMDQLSAALNARYGAPHGHWRIGTTSDGAELWSMMRDGDVVAIGWDELGDLGDLVGSLRSREARDAIRGRILEIWPDKDPRAAGNAASQIWKFYNAIQQGDLVYAANGQQILGVGEVTGGYRYDADAEVFAHRRAVRWLETTPFKASSRTGLRTTVYNLAKATDIQVEARRHMLGPAKPELGADDTRKKVDPAPTGPIETQLDRKGQVILFGPPGTGKTYHAVQAAQNIVAWHTHGKRWASLSPEQRRALEKREDTRRIWMCTFHPAFSYEDFVEGLKPTTRDGQLSFEPRPGIFRRICERAAQQPDERFVLIIDEFNRGDAPRIFGELLTLLELDKRGKVPVVLPTSGEQFTVPRNVQIIATMNTADRSIAHLDAALRRRFGFLEFLPDPIVLAENRVEGVPLDALLDVLNARLLDVLGNQARNLQVGHAYLMGAKNIHTLRATFRYDVLPLLQEYCADDPEPLVELLGTGLYDRDGRRVRQDVFAAGQESAFLHALAALAPDDRLRTAEPSETELADDEEEDDEDATDDA